MTPRRRRRDDRGFVAAAELPFGLLLVVAATIVAITGATWFERHAAARAAADEAARAVVLADSWDEGAGRARAAVAEVAGNYGLSPGDLSLELEGTLERGADVTARITVVMPAAHIPLVGQIGSFHRTVTHTETVESYRSLPG